jgi:predicted site-specific integrase-resolvase
MSTEINGKIYYRTLEACKIAGISRATFFRWIGEGIIEDMASRDRRGWRLFTEEDIEKMRAEANRVHLDTRRWVMR